MRFRKLVILAGLLVAEYSAFGQVVDFASSRVPMAELSGPWRFHTGDDLAWANPGFDDSGWSLLNANKGWSEQGYRAYSGLAWYRLAVMLPARHGPLAFYVPNVDGSFEVFANGQLIGQVGGMPPRSHLVQESRMLFQIPETAADSGRLLLAVRIWAPSMRAGSVPGGINPAPRIGEARVMARWRRLQGRELYWANSRPMVELFANFIGALASLGLFALRRKEREYLWFGLYLLVWAVWNLEGLYAAFHPVPYILATILTYILVPTGYYLVIEVSRTICGEQRGRLFGAGAFFAAAGGAVLLYSNLQPSSGWGFAFNWALLGINVCLALIFYRGWRTGSRDAAILMLTVAYNLPFAFVGALSRTPPLAHHAWARAFRGFYFTGIVWPFPYWIPSLLGDLTNLVVLIVLIRRYARTRSDEERLESELEAARTVQKVLIPDEVPAIPGFQVHAVYKPASQVGGDFFQLIGTKNGGALLAVGDVSGKGMPAAMTVSLLVGTFRTLAHYTQSPGEILRAMNQRMLARSHGGFTTCLVIRVEADGTMTVSNAGHLAPYLEGNEIALDGGLPLGLSGDSTYPEAVSVLPPETQLTLLTDGIIEAQSPAKELFGFHRAAGISTQSAEEIASAAQRFGQHDDITVLTLTRLRVGEESAALATPPILSPA